MSSAKRRDIRNVKVPRSIVKEMNKIKRVQLHVFADAGNTACSAATVAVVEHSTGFVKGLLTSLGFRSTTRQSQGWS